MSLWAGEGGEQVVGSLRKTKEGGGVYPPWWL